MPNTEDCIRSAINGGGQFSKFSVNRDQDRPKKRKRNTKVAEAQAGPSSSSAVKERGSDEGRKAARSCAECKRMKLKCDRVFPCTTCVKRGLEGICPDGSLVTGRGTRYVLASTEELHEKIMHMAERIRTLEDALASLHLEHSACRPCTCQPDAANNGMVEPHPLLLGDLLLVKGQLELYGLKQGEQEKDEGETSKVRASSTPSESAAREEASHVCLDKCTDLHPFDEDFDTLEVNQILSPINETHTGEDGRPDSEKRTSYILELKHRKRLLSLLPPRDEADHLSHQAVMNASWLMNVNGRLEPVYRLLYKVYDGPVDVVKAQDIALVLIICAIGARVDIGPGAKPSLDVSLAIGDSCLDATTPSSKVSQKGRSPSKNRNGANDTERARMNRSNSEKRSSRAAHENYILAKEALCEVSVQSEPDFTVLQCLYLMTWYLAALADIKDAGKQATALMALSVRVAFKLNLHREETYMGLSEEEQQEKRILFWGILHFETAMRLGTDRVGALGSPHITTKRPVASIPGVVNSFPNNAEAIYHDYKLAFLDGCLMPVLAAIANAPKLKLHERDYYDILALDSHIRDFDIPKLIRQPIEELFGSFTIPSPAPSRCNSDSKTVNGGSNKERPNILAMIRARVYQETLVTILHLHQAFFYAHIRDHRPLVQRRFLPSAIASFGAAYAVIVSSRDFYEMEPELAVRLNFNWYNAFCAATTLFLLVVHKPFCPVALLSLQILEKARNLFQAASTSCYIAARSFPILREFYAKARSVFHRWLKESEGEMGVFGPNGEIYVCETRIDIIIERLQSISFSTSEAEATTGLLSLRQQNAVMLSPTKRDLTSVPLLSSRGEGEDELDQDELFYEMWEHAHKELTDIVRRMPEVMRDGAIEPRRATAARLIWGIIPIPDEPSVENKKDSAFMQDVDSEAADLDWAMFTDKLMHSSTTHYRGCDPNTPSTAIARNSAPLGLHSPATTVHSPAGSQSSFSMLDMCGEIEPNIAYAGAMDGYYEIPMAPEVSMVDTEADLSQGNGFGAFVEHYSPPPHIFGESTHEYANGNGREIGTFNMHGFVHDQKEATISGNVEPEAGTLGYLWEHRDMSFPYLTRY